MNDGWLWVFRLVNGVDILGRVDFDPAGGAGLPGCFRVEDAVRLGLATTPQGEVLVMVALSPAMTATRPGRPFMDLQLNGAAVAFGYGPCAPMQQEYRALRAGLALPGPRRVPPAGRH